MCYKVPYKIFIWFLFACCFQRCSTIKPINIVESGNTNNYTYSNPSPDGSGKIYMGREIAHIQAASIALKPRQYSRDITDSANLAIKKMHLLPASIVADIGAGTGYYTFRMSEKVPLGKVYAVEVQDELINFLNSQKSKYKNIIVVKGSEQSPELPDNSVNTVLMVETYHELAYPYEMLKAIKKTLTADGKLVLIERRIESHNTTSKHVMRVKQIKKELTANGFKLSQRRNFLPTEYFLIFKKATN